MVYNYLKSKKPKCFKNKVPWVFTVGDPENPIEKEDQRLNINSLSFALHSDHQFLIDKSLHATTVSISIIQSFGEELI